MKSEPLPLFTPHAAPAPALVGWPVLRLGFRPFYLGGTLLAALMVPWWVAIFLGYAPTASGVAPVLWHAHEMLFGFATAIIVGFLLTAGKAWTGLATPRGAALGALVLLWLAARVASVAAPYALYAVLDFALLPLVAGVFARLLLRARNHRNLPLALILALLASANLAFHLAVLGVLPVNAMAPLYAGLALIVMIECVITGRVIPAFTMSVTPGLKLVAPVWSERATLGATALGLALWVLAPPQGWTAAVLALAAVLHVQRWWRWHPWVARSRPILWILHVAYVWFAVGLLLLALSQMGWVLPSLGVHALAVGATGGLIIGMVTRTARGHTGRLLQVSRPEVLAYILVMAAALLRVVLPLAAPALYAQALVAAALCWSVAFGIYLWIYTPWLVRTRQDGKDG